MTLFTSFDPNSEIVDSPLRIGWFTSGSGDGSLGLLRSTTDAIAAGTLNARIEFVFCNREKGQRAKTDLLLEYVDENQIPLVTLSSYRLQRKYECIPRPKFREMFDSEVIDLLQPYSPQLSVHAGYMLIAPLLVKNFLTINLHPALPDGPQGTWQQVIWHLIDQKARESGVMVHVSTPDVDKGPVLAYCRYELTENSLDSMWSNIDGLSSVEIKQSEGESNDLFIAIRSAGLERERRILVATLIAIANGRIDPSNPQATTPVDMTNLVELRPII